MSGATTRRIQGSPDQVFKALADPSRRRILDLLSRKELPLKSIEERFPLSRPAVIKHIRILKACSLVRVRRAGRLTYHRLNSRPLRTVEQWMAKYETFWSDRLGRLQRQLESPK
jgi:DNA-binding transcriptional ArsR family regulator